MKPSVYVETTVVSYFTAGMSRDLLIAAHQQSTMDWWQIVRPKVDCYISPFVINEIALGDEALAQRRLEAISGFAVLAANAEIEKLAEQYYKAISNDFTALYRKMLELQKQFMDHLVTSPLPLSRVTESKSVQPTADSAQ